MSQTRIMMKLGGYTFSVDTAAYQSLSRTTAFRWAKHERPGQQPLLEWQGPGDDTMSLAGAVFPTYAGGLGQVGDMRAAAGKGDPLLMVDGYGKIHGYWCISSIRETGRHHLPGGAPQKIEFGLELMFYGSALS